MVEILLAHRLSRASPIWAPFGLVHIMPIDDPIPTRLLHGSCDPAHAACNCLLAKPARLFGLSDWHNALCMKQAESRFCAPSGINLQNMFLVRAQSSGEPDGLRDFARQEAVVSSTTFTPVPPPHKSKELAPPPTSARSLALRWDFYASSK